MNNNSTKVKTPIIYMYLLPGLLMFIVAVIIPLLYSIGMSFTDWTGGDKFNFVGLKNYVKLIHDEIFWDSFKNNVIMIVFLLISQIGLAYIFALFIQNKFVKIQEFHRKVIFLPAILSPVLVGLIWKLVYNVDIGFIANIMKKAGAGDKLIYWLDDPKIALYSICIALTWQYVGQFSIILMAGMQNINQSIIEQAEIDGANSFQKSFFVIMPNLKSTFFVCIVLCISGCMKMFDIIYVMTGGGPGRATMVTALYAYNTGIKVQKYSYSAAISVGIIILSLILIVFARALTKEEK